MSGSLGLFAGYGVEIEYMLARRGSLAVLPAADQVLAAEAGEAVADVEVGPLAWSNELVLHVIELKTNGPVPALGGAHRPFQEQVGRLNGLLEPLGGLLLPGGMHPLMNPDTDTRLWPHEAGEIYAAFDRVFGCHGHGWSNLQSVHLNLPFSGDQEFGRLHAAIRVLLPVMPALAASSPVVEGRLTGLMDSRLQAYRENCRRLPAVTGAVVPEPAFTRAEYQARILEAVYQALAPHDPDGVLRHEWANARGAIARFERDTIEIRVLDTQECPAADFAVLEAIVSVLQALVEERLADGARQRRWGVEPLARILLDVMRHADHAVIDNEDYLDLLGHAAPTATAGELWQDLLERYPPHPLPEPDVRRALAVILDQGCLARRLARALGPAPAPGRIREVWTELAACLAEGRSFEAA